MKAARGRQRSAPEVWRSRLRLRATGGVHEGMESGAFPRLIYLSIYLLIKKKSHQSRFWGGRIGGFSRTNKRVLLNVSQI